MGGPGDTRWQASGITTAGLVFVCAPSSCPARIHYHLLGTILHVAIVEATVTRSVKLVLFWRLKARAGPRTLLVSPSY